MSYRTQCCEHHHLSNDITASVSLSFGEGWGEELSRLIEKYIREAFDERMVSEELSEKLWRYYYRYLSKAVDLGYNPTLEQYDPKLAHSLKYNIAEFSAFKETSFKKQIETVLTKNGRVLSWGEFRAEADKLGAEYNRRWLQTEYHQTIANAQAAEKFQEYIHDKDVYPNLRYCAVNDGRTREMHRAWDGLVLPVEHPFWQKYLPPNDWGCRCYVEQTASPPQPLPEGVGLSVRTEFAHNPALSGNIFNEIPYKKTLSEAETKQVQEKVKERLERDKGKKIDLERYKDIPFKELPIKGNGKLEIFTSGKQRKQEFKPNLETLNILASKGYQYKLLPVLEDGNKNPDAFNLLTKKFADIKNAEGINGKNIIQSAIKEAKTQGVEELIIRLKNKPDSYRNMLGNTLFSIKEKRMGLIEEIKVIFPNNEVKSYSIERLKKMVK